MSFVFGAINIENHIECNYDYLQVRDGLLPDSEELLTVCGSSTPRWLSLNSRFSINFKVNYLGMVFDILLVLWKHQAPVLGFIFILITPMKILALEFNGLPSQTLIIAAEF